MQVDNLVAKKENGNAYRIKIKKYSPPCQIS